MLNIKKIFKANWIVVLVFGLVMSMTTILFSGFSNKMIEMNNVYSHSSYDASGYLPRDSFVDKNCYYSNLSYVFLTKNDETISANTLMTKNDIDYCNTHFVNLNGVQIKDNTLSSTECSISKNTAEHYSLQVGDIIKAKTVGTFEYKIKYVFDTFYGLDEPNYFGDEYLVILGENADFINSLQTYNTYVLAEKNFVFTGSGTLNSRQNTLSKIAKTNAIIYSGFSFLIIASLLITLLFFSKDLDNDYKYYFIEGFKKKTVLNGIIENSFNKWTWMFGPTILIYSITTLIMRTFSLILFSLLLSSMILCSLISIIVFYSSFCALSKRRIS